MKEKNLTRDCDVNKTSKTRISFLVLFLEKVWRRQIKRLNRRRCRKNVHKFNRSRAENMKGFKLTLRSSMPDEPFHQVNTLLTYFLGSVLLRESSNSHGTCNPWHRCYNNHSNWKNLNIHVSEIPKKIVHRQRFEEWNENKFWVNGHFFAMICWIWRMKKVHRMTKAIKTNSTGASIHPIGDRRWTMSIFLSSIFSVMMEICMC